MGRGGLVAFLMGAADFWGKQFLRHLETMLQWMAFQRVTDRKCGTKIRILFGAADLFTCVMMRMEKDVLNHVAAQVHQGALQYGCMILS